MGGGAVLKPLQGSGGAGVFFVSSDESPNLNQMIEAVGARWLHRRSGSTCPMPTKGDVRLFLMNGDPLTVEGTTPRSVESTPPPTSLEHASRR